MTKAKTPKQRKPTDKEFEALVNFGPALDKATMLKIENVAGGQNIGTKRRVSLGALTLSAEELAHASETDQETYTEMRRAIEDFKKHAEGLLDLATTAEIRMSIVDAGKSPLPA